MQEGQITKQEKKAKYTIKDSVFTNLFGDKKYLIQLYRALHPEDTETTENELTDITIENVLTDGVYNDLGFKVGERFLILVEAQSTWTENIVIRILMYLVQTYHDYFERNHMNLYRSRKVKIPQPELYVIFTGERKDKPEYISLSKEFFGGEECALEVKVKVIYDGRNNDIISQYVAFTKVYNEQMKLYGRTRRTVEETIRICKDRNVLREYLESKETEVVNIMMTLFDEESIIRNYVADEKKEAAREAAVKMLRTGKLSVEEIAACLTEISVEEVRALDTEMAQTV